MVKISLGDGFLCGDVFLDLKEVFLGEFLSLIIYLLSFAYCMCEVGFLFYAITNCYFYVEILL